MYPRGLGLGSITLADAIARQENVRPDLNNPGALTAAPDRFCQLGKDGILVKFCSYQDGLDALNNQIELNANRGMSLKSFFESYSPAASGNDPDTYARNVASWTGIDSDTPLNSVDPGLLFTNYSSVDVFGGDPTGTGMNWGLIALLGLLGIVVASEIL